ncbi:MAG: hypothetical protein ACE5FA_00065 [Dehalococcoidia bacterium]
MSAQEDADRWDPEMVAWFRSHQRRWAAREIRLIDYCEQHVKQGDIIRPLWYPSPLGELVKDIDKAVLFEKIDYWPSEPACRAHASLAHIKFFSGGARAGKSLWAGTEAAPVLLTPGRQIWIVGPEYFNCVKEFRYLKGFTVDHRVVGPSVKASGVRVAKNVDRPEQGDMEIRLRWPNGQADSWVRCKSAKTLPTLLSEELDMIILCEAALIPGHIWQNKLRMRLVDRNGVLLVPTSPAGTGWTKDLYERGLSGEPGHFSISADTRTNPTQNLANVAFWSKGMSDTDFEEQVRGRPTPKHGLVYPGFDRMIHVESYRSAWPQPDDARKKRSWRRARAVDFGYQDPLAMLWAAFDEDRRVYVYREFFKRRTLVDELCEHVAKVEGREFLRDEKGRIRVSGAKGTQDPITGPIVADWDAQMRAELGARGLRCRRANKDVLAGIATVAEHLKIQGDGRPRLYIHPSCRNLLGEMMNYEWAKDGGDHPRDGNDHAMDALRYLLHTLRASGRRRILGAIQG